MRWLSMQRHLLLSSTTIPSDIFVCPCAHLRVHYGMYLFVCVYVHSVYECVCMCTWRLEISLRVSPNHCPSYFLRQGATLTQELSDLSRLDGQWVSGILLSLPPQCRSYRHTYSACLMCVLGIQTHVLMLANWTLYQLNHLGCPLIRCLLISSTRSTSRSLWKERIQG